MSVLDSIVKAYDIRGTVPDQLDADVAHALGVGFAAFVRSDRVVIGRDMRPSGPELVEAFTRGVIEQGIDVIDIGLASTDLMYYAAGVLDVPGAMFTASHNPAGYNGVKLCLAGARPIGVDTGLADVQAVAQQVLDGGGPRQAVTCGSRSERELLSDFADHVVSFIDPADIGSMKVVADTANGMGGLVVPAVFERLNGVELEVMFGELDGTFPNHPADPLQPANQRDLSRSGGLRRLRSRPRVRRRRRPGVRRRRDRQRPQRVDDHGHPRRGDPASASGCHDPAQPDLLEDRSRGGPRTRRTPVRTKVGHSFIKQIMAETGAVFGGEHSAHYYFARNFNADSGLIASLMVMAEVGRSGQQLSVVRQPYERYAASGEINTQVDDALAVIERISGEYAEFDQDRLDGLTVDCGTWWFNLRPSNTEPLLRLNLEAADRASCDDAVGTLLAQITS